MPKKIISIVSGKGGVGKSSLAVNLAVLCAKSGASTILIDADIYNPCAFFHLGLSPQSTGLQDILNKKSRLEESLPIHPASGLRCISSSLHEQKTINYGRFKNLIKTLNYEYVFIDCPPGYSPLIEEATAASNHIFVMMTPDLPSCTAALKLVTFVKNRVGAAKANFSYFLNRVSNASYEISEREVESLFHSSISASIPEDENVPRSIAAKTPLTLFNAKSPFSRTLKQYTSMMLSDRDRRFDLRKSPLRRAPAQAQQGGSNGIFGRLFGIVGVFSMVGSLLHIKKSPKTQPAEKSAAKNTRNSIETRRKGARLAAQRKKAMMGGRKKLSGKPHGVRILKDEAGFQKARALAQAHSLSIQKSRAKAEEENAQKTKQAQENI